MVVIKFCEMHSQIASSMIDCKHVVVDVCGLVFFYYGYPIRCFIVFGR